MLVITGQVLRVTLALPGARGSHRHHLHQVLIIFCCQIQIIKSSPVRDQGDHGLL